MVHTINQHPLLMLIWSHTSVSYILNWVYTVCDTYFSWNPLARDAVQERNIRVKKHTCSEEWDPPLAFIQQTLEKSSARSFSSRKEVIAPPAVIAISEYSSKSLLTKRAGMPLYDATVTGRRDAACAEMQAIKAGDPFRLSSFFFHGHEHQRSEFWAWRSPTLLGHTNTLVVLLEYVLIQTLQ